MDGWVGRTAVEIAAAVRSGAVSPQEVVRQHLRHIADRDPQVGAFVRVRHQRATAEATELAARADLGTLPLAGVPVAVKDNVPVRDEPTRYGATVTSDAPAVADHEVVRRLRQAGAVVVGLTRMPELGVWATCEDAAGGVARNPWDLTRTPGGSSGGSAAAVAAAMVPVAHGNDGLGSIRIPAACCGLVGVKPGPGVVPADVGATSWHGLVENGPLATTVADAALLLSVLACRPEAARVASGLPAPLRVAVSTRVPLPGIRVDPEITTALVRTAVALREAGHRVSRADPPYTRRTADVIVAWYAAAVADELRGLDEGRLEPRQRRQAQLGRAARRLGLVREADRTRWRQQVDRFFAAHDLLVTPVTTAVPPAAEGWRAASWRANFWGNARWVPYPGAWNLAGCPAAAVPAAMHSTGLPIGVQLVAPPGGEGLLLSVAAQLEVRRPWPRHAPGAGVAAITP